MGGGKAATQKGPSFTKSQKRLLGQLVGQMSSQLGQGVESYLGPTVAQPTEALNNIFSQTGGLASQLESGEGYYAPAAASGDVLTSLMQPYDKESASDYWRQSFVNPAMDVYQKEILPQILESYGAKNALSSSGMGTALAKSGESLTTNLGAKLADILYQGEQAQKGYQLQAAGQAQNLAGLPGNILNSLLAPAGQEYNIQQALVAEPYQKWLYEQPYNNPWLNLLGGGALSTPANASTATSPGPGAMDYLTSILTGATTGWATGGFKGIG